MRARQQEVLQNFNPRSHERSDHKRQTVCQRCKRFQSTLPREERRLQPYGMSQLHTISIHAPTRGATLPSETGSSAIKISIHAPTRGATKKLYGTQLRLTFQSTLPREERRVQRCPLSYFFNFNPRSHERSDYSRGD